MLLYSPRDNKDYLGLAAHDGQTGDIHTAPAWALSLLSLLLSVLLLALLFFFLKLGFFLKMDIFFIV